MRLLFSVPALIITLLIYSPAICQNQDKNDNLQQIEQSLKTDIPRILCLNKNIATGGQPSEQAFGKLAAQGFRSVLNLRTASEGVDIEKERELVERSGMRYISIPVLSSAPDPKQVEEFINAVKVETNHPMLIHCATANRVGAFWMIYRVKEEGWSEEKALEEAVKIGLTNPTLKTFAHSYISQSRQK
jgi:uncharacterized protein (TIGR01244 family)